MTSPATTIDLNPSFCRRMYAIALRHIYLYRGSWPRLIEMMYWPALNMTLFGFISLSMVHRFGHSDVMTDSFLAGVMLSEVLTRNTVAMLIMYLEEIWSRNLGHLFASPISVREYIVSLIGLSAIMRTLLALIPAYIIVYYLFHFSILTLGWNLPLYWLLLSLQSWWFGLFVLCILLRYGLAAEWLGWMSSWLLMPFMAPYFPVSILPLAFRVVSWSLPGTYVFESVKAQLATGQARYDYLGIALILNLIYLILASFAFKRAFQSARNSGGLLQMGE